MKHEIETCPICEKIIKFDKKAMTTIDGCAFNFGYSYNGWGNRRSPIQFSEEICHECFLYIEEHFEGLQKLLIARKGINKESLSVIGKGEQNSKHKDFLFGNLHRPKIEESL